jgi:DNA-binding NtrC family response regulator
MRRASPTNSDAALAAVDERRPSLVLLDIWLHGSKLDGLELLSLFKEQHQDLPVVMFSGHGNIETAVSAIKRGAYEYIEKPFKADRLVLVVGRALEASRLKREISSCAAGLVPKPSFSAPRRRPGSCARRSARSRPATAA